VVEVDKQKKRISLSLKKETDEKRQSLRGPAAPIDKSPKQGGGRRDSRGQDRKVLSEPAKPLSHSPFAALKGLGK
jgi:transcriptional accessory protein Tex/SPT6